MKQCFLKKTDKKSLDLVFLGYGQDEKPFQYLKDITPNSVALVYDYTDRDFDPSLYYEFEDINLITWSMGVMAAPKVLNKYDLLKKVKMLRMISLKTGTCYQRCVGCDAINSLYSTTYEIDQKHKTQYHERFKKFLLQLQENDWMVAGAMTDVKGDRSLRSH